MFQREQKNVPGKYRDLVYGCNFFVNEYMYMQEQEQHTLPSNRKLTVTSCEQVIRV